MELKKNVHAITDPGYIELLNRLRVGKGTMTRDRNIFNYDVLKSQLLDKLQLDQPNEYDVLCNAPVVFCEQCLRNLFNDMKAKQFMVQTQQEYHVYLTSNKINKQVVQEEE